MSARYEFPGFVDVHVHFRDPGVSEAETTASGLMAAERGGIGAVVTMPNTSPAIDTPERLKAQLAAAARANSPVRLYASAAITRERLGEALTDLEALADAGAAFFTDDGAFVTDDRVMELAMSRAADLGMVICEHALMPTDGVIRDCPLARRLGLKVIPVTAETEAIARDLRLCRETGCRLHIQHISTAAGVEMVRGAQREGLPVTAEATPHHLLIACDDIPSDDANFKMAPPLGNREDRDELRRAVKEGVLFFATDHAPHPANKKNLGFAQSANGIIGLETAIPLTYAVMVEEMGMSLDAWARAWYEAPTCLIRGFDAAQVPPTVVTVGEARTIDMQNFASKSRNSPYQGLIGRCWPCK